MFFERLDKPYFAVGGFPRKEKWIFFSPFGEVEIGGCVNLLSKLLPLCNGENSLGQIKEEILPFFTDEEISQVVELLFRYHIIVDSNRIFYNFYAISRNPSPFSTNISQEESCSLIRDKSHLPVVSGDQDALFQFQFEKTTLNTLLQKRKTMRKFAGDGLVESEILNLMWSMYGKQEEREDIKEYFQDCTYNAPSGGALYPIFNYVFLFQECDNLLPGLYLWHKELSSLEILRSGQFRSELSGVITGVENLEGTTGLVCSVADFERSAKKYGNKAYSLIYLEAGHLMQSAYLFCAERNIGFVEIAGYLDEALAKILRLNFPQKIPLVVAAFGR